MDGSYVIIWHGSAGSGKSLSATVQCCIDMVCYGQTVYSMVPISFDFYMDDESPPVSYQSKWLDLDRLLLQDEMFRNSIVFWDEINLWLFSRNHAALFNKVVGQLITLRRKLDMSFYATSQFLSLVEKNFRIQADAEIFCFDLHFEYNNLRQGQVIKHELKDISGKFTGRMHEMSGMVYERILHGEPFHGTYPTKHTFDIFEAMRKYKVRQHAKELDFDNDRRMTVTTDDLSEADIKGGMWEMTRKVSDLCSKLEGDTWYTSDIQDYLRNNGVDGTPIQIGRMMSGAGYKKKRVDNLNYVYYKPDEELIKI